jgi:predicted LPLAT superfamily acyltransferase
MTQGKQRGSAWSIQLAFYVYKTFGYKFLYYLLYPITFFYFLVAKNAKEPLKIYYRNLGIKFNNRIYYNHLRVFAICMVDRFISKIDPQNYSFDYGDVDIPIEILESGSVLVYSHFGGWAASSNGAHVKNKINIVMQEAMLEGMKNIEKGLGLKSQLNIIDLDQGSIAVSVQIANALMNEEVVTIMADRASNEKAEMEIKFLNKKANFNKNPFQIAYKTDKPMLAYFIVLTGIQKYKVKYVQIELDRSKAEDIAVREALTQYVNKLEEVVKRYPDQWFNFYDFWEKK